MNSLNGPVGLGNDGSPPPRRKWYYAQTPDGVVRQVVLSLPQENISESEFGLFLLSYDRFPVLVCQTWCAGFFRLDGKPRPYLMARVGDFAEAVRSVPMTIAFSFCRLESGGIFLVSIRLESESLGSDVRRVFPQSPPLRYPVVEWVTGLNDDYVRKLIGDGLSQAELHLAFARNSNSSSLVVFPDGTSQRTVPPQAAFDLRLPVEKEATERLNQEWAELLRHHTSIPGYRRNFDAAQAELGRRLLFNEDPILGQA